MNISVESKHRLEEIFQAFTNVCEGSYVFINEMRSDLSKWSSTAVDLFDLPGEYMVDAGGIWEEHIHPDDREAYHNSIAAIMNGRAGGHDMQYRARDRQGNYVMCTCKGVVIHDVNGSPAYFVGSIRNHGLDGNIDVMTGLRNQKGFLEDLEDVLVTGKPFYAAIIGINHFSEINALYGYNFGNLVIQKISRLFLEKLLNDGRVYRLDGVRFGLITRTLSPDQAVAAYDQFKEEARNGFYIDGKHVSAMTSEGGIYVDSFDVNVSTIHACLESAFEESKWNRMGEAVIFSSIAGEQQKETIEQLSRIRRSISEGCKKFILYYQPIMNADSQTLRGAEALIRYQDRKQGLIFPDAFIPFLEHDSIFPELGDWILRKAMEDGVRFVRKVPDFIMNVNLSYVQVKKEDFTDTVKRLLQETGFPAENLCLEITERCRLLNKEKLKNTIHELRQYGIKIALDDFGTGFSSASLLYELSFDTIKIDRAFVRNVLTDPKSKEALSYLIGFAQTFGSDVCVEGIEDEAARKAVMEYHATSLQGYLYSKPVPIERFEEKMIAS